jgi:hypothetical protein
VDDAAKEDGWAGDGEGGVGWWGRRGGGECGFGFAVGAEEGEGVAGHLDGCVIWTTYTGGSIRDREPLRPRPQRELGDVLAIGCPGDKTTTA